MTTTGLSKLKGKVAFVTGGGRGLGSAISRELATAGAHVFMTGRSLTSLRATADAIEAMGVKCAFADVDVTDQEGMLSAVEQCKAELGAIDVLVNNAGIGSHGAIASCDIDEWWQVMEVNVKGPLITSRAVLPGMISRGAGHIINIGSYQANGPAPMVSAYATSKAALLRLTDSMAAEVIDAGVTVIALSPGFVRTDMGLQAESIMTELVPGFEGFPQDFTFGADAIATLVCRVAAGETDAFYGRMLHVRDDLDALLAEAETILEEDRFALVFQT